MKPLPLKKGDLAPVFGLDDEAGEYKNLIEFSGKWVVLYFYPKDDTPGCTVEAIDFTKNLKKFEELNSVILGVSPDSGKSHCKFIEKHGLKVPLLSDPEHRALEKYGVWKEKSLYGRKFMGVERSTFLINPKGRIEEVWRKVKVKGHINEVLERLKSTVRN